ncbi:hypothetical protein EXIGLDRAFT_720797 [Exidia glandulosa HHB12029]|uniref:Uncharacterized protein n=1 Tax=Exidia glandulosa HHB12029 TaxID=1314781 RepID=A0A165G4L9_EXIGL|nr:hypothetical protein EXIGLDRAFT_720797 [Exidia glandulosa HHB12029]
MCREELNAMRDDEPGSSSFRCACRNGGIVSLDDVSALIRASIRLSTPLHELQLFGVRATVDVDPVAAFLALKTITHEVVVREEVAPEVKRAKALWKQRENSHFWAPSDVFDPFLSTTFTADGERFDQLGPRLPTY